MDFISRESSRFVGREDFIQDVVDYVSSDSDAPLVISGAFGSGKTALAAKLDAVLGRLSTEPVDSREDARRNRDNMALKDRTISDAAVAPRVTKGHDTVDNRESLALRTDNELASFKSISALRSSQHIPLNNNEESHRQSPTSNTSYRHTLNSPLRLTLINGLVSALTSSSSLSSFEDLSRRLLSFLGFSFDDRVASVCGNWAALAREALSADYDSSRVIILDGIQFLRGETFSVATKLSWLPLKLGRIRIFIGLVILRSKPQLFRCVHASLQEGLSVGPSVGC